MFWVQPDPLAIAPPTYRTAFQRLADNTQNSFVDFLGRSLHLLSCFVYLQPSTELDCSSLANFAVRYEAPSFRPFKIFRGAPVKPRVITYGRRRGDGDSRLPSSLLNFSSLWENWDILFFLLGFSFSPLRKIWKIFKMGRGKGKVSDLI